MINTLIQTKSRGCLRYRLVKVWNATMSYVELYDIGVVKVWNATAVLWLSLLNRCDYNMERHNCLMCMFKVLIVLFFWLLSRKTNRKLLESKCYYSMIFLAYILWGSFFNLRLLSYKNEYNRIVIDCWIEILWRLPSYHVHYLVNYLFEGNQKISTFVASMSLFYSF